MARTISTDDNVIDSRDVIARIDALTDELQDVYDGLIDAGHELAPFADWCAAQVDGDLEAAYAELRVWRDVQDQSEGYCDWTHGEPLIRDSHFEDYARELAEDLYGDKLRDARWPFDHIDWESAADALRADYMGIDVDGVAYWVRS